MDILSLTPAVFAAIPVVIGLSAVIRQLGLPERYSPLADLVLGILTVFLIGAVSLQADVLQGLLVGLSAAGLYNGTQVVAGSLVKAAPQNLG